MGVKVYTGRDRGKLVRLDARLDYFDHQGISVEVSVPRDTYLASSFFMGMFGKSIRFLGSDLFRKRYTFVGFDVQDVVAHCIMLCTYFGESE
jgi:hypothetical protein